ncbi:hypothetical protein EBR96_05640, partial [bacterium]|nr:hypothetical protein [bacterium]
AGPLLFNGQDATGLIYAPFATTEGALVATLTKGAQALSRAGGVKTRVHSQRMIRVPIFDFYDIDNAAAFTDWIDTHFDEIKAVTQRYTRFGNLIAINCDILGPSVLTEFVYSTGDASGQNMTTTCTWHAILWIKDQVGSRFGIKNMMIESVSSSDKRASAYNLLKGRGIRVTAEAKIPDEVTQSVLGTTSESIVRSYQRFAMSSSQIGAIGVNVNAANTIAAMFTATGQDIACTAESSVSYMYLEKTDDGFYVSMTLPSLVIATIGGGTHLPHQREYLEMLGCYGAGKVNRLAEIIAGFTLALDICTLSAIDSGRFAVAHEKLGRNRPVKWFTQADFTNRFFEPGLKAAFGDSTIVNSVTPTSVQLGSSIISELTSRKVDKTVGFFNFRISYTSDTESNTNAIDLIAKVKPLDTEVMMMVGVLAALGQTELAETYPRYKEQTGFKCCDIKELAIYKESDKRFTTHVPRIFDTIQDNEKETRIVIMEYVQDAIFRDTGDDTRDWDDPHIRIVLDGLADLHSVWFRRDSELKQTEWIGSIPSAATMIAMQPLFAALLNNGVAEHEWFDDRDYSVRKTILDTLPEWIGDLDLLPKTLVHNDFNPRNLFIRPTSNGGSLCVYDWELATVHLPQYDLAEFLIFVLQPNDVTKEKVAEYVEYYRNKLSQSVGESLNKTDWETGFWLCVNDFCLFRMGMYLMAHVQRDYGFMIRIVKTATRLLEIRHQ